MESFKIENFEKYYDDVIFPKFKELDAREINEFQKKLTLKLGMSEINLLNLTASIRRMSTGIEKINAQSEGFDFNELLSSLHTEKIESVYINWYRFDVIDKMKLIDFAKYFDDIWYPESDDVDIFDDSMSWFVSIHSNGAVSYLKNIIKP